MKLQNIKHRDIKRGLDIHVLTPDGEIFDTWHVTYNSLNDFGFEFYSKRYQTLSWVSYEDIDTDLLYKEVWSL